MKLTLDLCFDDDHRVMSPSIPCGHETRHRILLALTEQLPISHLTWARLEPANIWPMGPMEHTLTAIDSGGFIASSAEIAISFVMNRDYCTRCKSNRTATIPNLEEADIGAPDAHAPDEQELANDDSDLEGENRENHLKLTVPTDIRRRFGARNRLAPPRRGAKRKANVDLPDQEFIPLRDDYFDDYLGGPSLEDMQWLERQGGCEAYPIAWFPTLTQRSPWELFKDYGYRLQRSFSTMFNESTPFAVVDHLLPPGQAHPLPQLEAGQDSRVVGLSYLLDNTGGPSTPESIQAFVQGKIDEDTFIVLDLEQDAYPLSADEILFSLDIDSIIWVTPKLKVRTQLNIHLFPDQLRTAPIGVHNHVYAELLLPQSEEDKETGEREEWHTHRCPLSNIPHARFGKVGLGAGSLNVYVFWPRMKHKNTHTNKWAAVVPTAIQSRWISEVILPSIVECSNPATKPYVDFTLEQLEMKTPKNSQGTKSTVVDAEQLEQIQISMHQRIKGGHRRLEMFGSFFFVVDARGIKKTTTVIKDGVPNPYDLLVKNYPGMDWGYMMDRQNGELYMDLGMAFHPQPTSEEPLVGLWRLGQLRESFAAAGMNSGTNHHVNTLADYGGIQSEMGPQRAAIVQLTFRSAYNLVFEIVRRSGDAYFCDDPDAHDVNHAFLDCVDKYQKMYTTSSGKSYGVRDEVRGSGRAILEALPSAFQKVKDILH
jgi:hypothetical protein